MTVLVFDKVFRPSIRPVFSGKPFSPLDLFSSGETGVWYDPSDFSTMFQNSTGTTPVTATGNSVGLLLSKSQGAVLGTNLVTNGSFDTDTNWTKGTGWSIGGGVATVNNTSGVNQSLYQGLSGVSGQKYAIQIAVSNRSGAGSLFIYWGNTTLSNMASNGSYTFYVDLTLGTNNFFVTANNGVSADIDEVSVRKVLGISASQAASGDRPILSNDFALETVSADSINWVAPAGTYTVAYRGSTGTVILDAQSLSGATNVMQTTKIYEYIAVDRALGSAEKRRLQAYLDSKGALL